MEFGELEAEIYGIVKRSGEIAARDVLDKVNSKGASLAYTTVSTTLDRLYKKGLLKRKGAPARGGLKYLYHSAEDPKVQKEVVRSAVDKLVNAFGPTVVSAIYERLENISPSELDVLKKRIEDKRKER